jgi:hypothetical protein
MTFGESTQPSAFDDVTVYTPGDLKRDPFFWPRHGAFLEAHPRVELWKPYLIRKRMKKLADGDSLLYVDAGWRVSGELVSRPSDPVIGVATDQPEGVWTKMDLLLKLKALPLADTPQCRTSALLFYVGPDTRQLVNKWYTLACDYHNVDQSPSKQRDLPDFREHLDRSLFSLLAKTKGLLSALSLAVSPDEVDGADAVGRTEVDHDAGDVLVDPGLASDHEIL